VQGHFDPQPRRESGLDAGSRATHAAAVDRFCESSALFGLAPRRIVSAYDLTIDLEYSI
jgi:hypothetical protein